MVKNEKYKIFLTINTIMNYISDEEFQRRNIIAENKAREIFNIIKLKYDDINIHTSNCCVTIQFLMEEKKRKRNDDNFSGISISTCSVLGSIKPEDNYNVHITLIDGFGNSLKKDKSISSYLSEDLLNEIERYKELISKN